MTKIPRQITSLAIIAAIAVTGLIVARILFIPKSFGEYGFYRGDVEGEMAAKEMKYAGHQVCIDCHDDIYEKKVKSNHKNVNCEVCHGPSAAHAEAPDEVLPSIPDKRGMCPLCHDFNPSRPTGFPQINTSLHNTGKACMSCHDPHNPLLPHKPEECSACHQQIYNQKRISPHAPLECTVCHETPELHLETPRFAKANKPTNRAFCGKCHASEEGTEKSIPQVDLIEHGEAYACWDCHYPHHPEAN